MTKPFWASLCLICSLLFLGSCASYYIPVESFKQQFAGIDPSEYKYVATEGPMGDVVKYKTFPLDSIRCIDKKGNPVTLKKSPSLEIRFTDSNGRRTVFYFDRIVVSGNEVRGNQSRFIAFIQKSIYLNTIKLIEIQDGRKRFSYVQQ